MTASSPTCPGVSVEELSSSVRGISMVTTSVAVSVGHACQGPVIQAATSTGFAEFERRSGGLRVTDDHDPHSPGGFQSAGHGRRRSAEFHTGPVHTRRPGRCAHRTAAFAVPARSVPGIVTPRGALRHMRQGHHPAVRLRPRDHPCHHPIRTGQASGMRDRHDRAAGRAVREPGLSSWSSPSMNNGSSPPRTVRFTASSGMAGSSRGPWEQPAEAHRRGRQTPERRRREHSARVSTCVTHRCPEGATRARSPTSERPSRHWPRPFPRRRHRRRRHRRTSEPEGNPDHGNTSHRGPAAQGNRRASQLGPATRPQRPTLSFPRRA
jgi:hypothetical protein